MLLKFRVSIVESQEKSEEELQEILTTLGKAFAGYSKSGHWEITKTGYSDSALTAVSYEEATEFHRRMLLFEKIIEGLYAANLRDRENKANVFEDLDALQPKENYLQLRIQNDTPTAPMAHNYLNNLYRLVNIHIFFEELHNGFLIFFHEREDFEKIMYGLISVAQKEHKDHQEYRESKDQKTFSKVSEI